MISKTNGLIDYMNKQHKGYSTIISKTNSLINYMNKRHKGYSTMERTFHLWFTKWEFNFLFSFRTLTMRSVSACFVLKSTKHLMVVLRNAYDCVVCFLNMSTSSLSAEEESHFTTSLASRAWAVGNSWCTIGPVPLLWDDTTSMGTSLFDLGLTCFAIKVPIGFRKFEVSKTSKLGVITAN